MHGVPCHTLPPHMVWSASDAMQMMDYFNIFVTDLFQNSIFQQKNATIEEESELLRAWDLRHFIAAMHDHLATFWMQAETVDHLNVHFYFDFSGLRQTHFCRQGRPTQFESLCPPFGHVFHATVFLLYVHYM